MIKQPWESLNDTDLKRKSELETSHKRIKKQNDPRFGDIQVYQDPVSKRMLAVKDTHINDKKAAMRAVAQARQRIRNQSPHVLGLVDYSVDLEKGLCSSFYNLRLFYDYPQSDLKKEAADRAKANLRFNNEELVNLLYQQVGANKHLELSGSFHGDVRPVHWGLNRQQWESKLIHKQEDIGSREDVLQVQTNRIKHGDALYQSPGMFEALKKKQKNVAFTPNKEDMFATALVVVELGNGQSVQDIYKGKGGTFDHDKMRQHVARFEENFPGQNNQLLVTSVLTMLEPDEARRPHFVLLSDHMPQHEAIRQHFRNYNKAELVY